MHVVMLKSYGSINDYQCLLVYFVARTDREKLLLIVLFVVNGHTVMTEVQV